MISIIPEYRNRNILIKWINSHQHHTCIFMGTVLFPFSYKIEQLKLQTQRVVNLAQHMYSCSHLSRMVNIVRFSVFQYLLLFPPGHACQTSILRPYQPSACPHCRLSALPSVCRPHRPYGTLYRTRGHQRNCASTKLCYTLII
jgi:hypothetical protein